MDHPQAGLGKPTTVRMVETVQHGIESAISSNCNDHLGAVGISLPGKASGIDEAGASGELRWQAMAAKLAAHFIEQGCGTPVGRIWV
jgi:hypothetical protein